MLFSDIVCKLPFEIICSNHHKLEISVSIISQKFFFEDKKCKKTVSLPFEFSDTDGVIPFRCHNKEMGLISSGINQNYTCGVCFFKIKIKKPNFKSNKINLKKYIENYENIPHY